MNKLAWGRLVVLGVAFLTLADSCETVKPVPVLNRQPSNDRLDLIKLPPGFKIHAYATGVVNARQMALGTDGTVFVGSRDEGRVYALQDLNGDQDADTLFTIAKNLYLPSGVAFRDGALYVAEVNRVIRYDNIETQLAHPPTPVVVNDTFPSEGYHGWKFIQFGPDGKLYVPVGAPCNVCDTPDPRFASIMRMNADGSDLEVFARGIRNSVGFDWNPATQELWFTDNGRDLMGNNLPPDELNRAPVAGLHFGFPYHHGKAVIDPEFGSRRSKTTTVSPAQELGPHVAAIGMRFYTGQQFPEPYRNQIFIAEHGSWNRDAKIGYRISLVKLKGSEPVNYETFAEGWLQGQEEWGRPSDVMVMPDGALLVSDDTADMIYRISYKP